jgi:hypothetical protein
VKVKPCTWSSLGVKFVISQQNLTYLQVLEAITKLKGRHHLAEDAILRLNSSLLEITQVCQ